MPEQRLEGSQLRILRQLPQLGLQVGNSVLQRRRIRVHQLELLNHLIVQGHRQIGRQPQRSHHVAVQASQQRVLIPQQVGPLGLDALPELVDLHQVDDAGVQVRFEQGQGPELQVQAVLRIAVLLQLLQQAQVAADRAFTAAGEPRAAAATAATAGAEARASKASGRPDAAQAARARAGKAGQAGPAQKAAAPRRTGDAQVTDGHPGVEPVPIAFKRTQVAQQRTFHNGQLFQRDIPPRAAQQRLDQRETADRTDQVGVPARKLPDERIGETDQQFGPRGELPLDAERRVGDRPAHRQPILLGRLPRRLDFEPPRQRVVPQAGPRQIPVVRVHGIRPAEELGVQAKPLGAHIQGRQVQRLELLLVVRRMHEGQLQGRVDIQHDLAAFVLRHILAQVRPPVRILQLVPVPVAVPMRPAFLAVQTMHVLMRVRIVRRHRRLVGIVFVVVPTPLVQLDRKVGDRPARVGRLLLNQLLDLAIRLQAIVLTVAAWTGC